jgi:putative membrane protein insertion efficiency factor
MNSPSPFTRWRRWPRALVAAPIRAYRFFLSPWLGSACRFEPTCSRYALDALETHGALTGSYLAASRLIRCHPWCDGGFDPVPPADRPAPTPAERQPS